jgi:hypothetical protein
MKGFAVAIKRKDGSLFLAAPSQGFATPVFLPASGAAQPNLQPVLEAMENLNGRALRDGGTVGLSWQIGLLREAMAGHQGAGKMGDGVE